MDQKNSRISVNRQSSKREFRISSSSQKKKKTAAYNRAQTSEEKINNRLKKAYIIQMLIKLQNLRHDDINSAMKDMLLSAQKQYADNTGDQGNGIKAALKYFGDPVYLFNQYTKSQEKIEEQERRAYAKLQRQ